MGAYSALAEHHRLEDTIAGLSARWRRLVAPTIGKANRWLGFSQGYLVARGVLDLDDVRRHSQIAVECERDEGPHPERDLADHLRDIATGTPAPRLGVDFGDDIGRRIRVRRVELGGSGVDLARACGVSSSTVTRWERGQRLPSIEQLLVLARELKISPADLLGPT